MPSALYSSNYSATANNILNKFDASPIYDSATGAWSFKDSSGVDLLTLNPSGSLYSTRPILATNGCSILGVDGDFPILTLQQTADSTGASLYWDAGALTLEVGSFASPVTAMTWTTSAISLNKATTHLSAVGAAYTANASFPYIGAKTSSVMMSVSGSGGTYLNNGLYYDGAWKHSTLNIGGATLILSGGASDGINAFAIQTSRDYSHAADSTATLASVFSITQAGAVTMLGPVTIQTMADSAGTWPVRFNTGTGLITYQSSCRENKNSIENCSYGLAEVLQVIPRRFKRNGDGDRWFIGMVADELVDIMPELTPMIPRKYVVKDSDDETLIPGGIDYPEYTAVLTNAVKELHAQLAETRAELAALRADTSV